MRLAIVGASARAAAFSALDAGHEVVAADLFADSDLVARCAAAKIDRWPDGLAAWLEQQNVDGWMYTGGLENHAKLVEHLTAICPLLGNGPEQIERSRNVHTVAQMFAAAQIPFPITQSSPPTNDGQWLIKSHLSAGGLGVADWEAGGQKGPNDYWQQRIAGRSISAVYVAAAGQVALLGITEQLIGRPWTGAGRYQYAGSIGPVTVADNLREQVNRAGEIVACECALRGLFGIDFVVTIDEAVYPVEINPRYTASLEVIERSTGRSAIAAHIEACLYDRVASWSMYVKDGFHGKAYIFARDDLQFYPLPWVDIADVPAAGTRVARGHPICTVLATSCSHAGIEPQLIKTAEMVSRHLR